MSDAPTPDPRLSALDKLVGKGSPNVYRGEWSDDGNTLTGEWVWPGGGYKETMTRIEP
jgi:hypothetical protein